MCVYLWLCARDFFNSLHLRHFNCWSKVFFLIGWTIFYIVQEMLHGSFMRLQLIQIQPMLNRLRTLKQSAEVVGWCVLHKKLRDRLVLYTLLDIRCIAMSSAVCFHYTSHVAIIQMGWIKDKHQCGCFWSFTIENKQTETKLFSLFINVISQMYFHFDSDKFHRYFLQTMFFCNYEFSTKLFLISINDTHQSDNNYSN